MFIYIFIISDYLQPLEIKELPLCKIIGNLDFFPFGLSKWYDIGAENYCSV